MKSVIKETTKKKEEIIYPFLMISTKSNRVVLFASNSCGVLVNSDCFDDQIGRHHSEWYMGDFVPFTGTIELSNED
ncbi:MAG: hypothetical protein QM500_19310 [Methylococcales bacterium]